MSSGAGTAAGRLGGRMPGWLAPRDEERRGRGELRLIETFVLVVIGIVLAVATIHDLGREVRIGDRLGADLLSWKRIVGAKYHNPLVEQDIKRYTTRDVVCADTEKGKPQGRVQICLIFTGPVHGEWRAAKGGYYLLAAGTDPHKPVVDKPGYSYGCAGTAVAEGLCAFKGKPPPPPRLGPAALAKL